MIRQIECWSLYLQGRYEEAARQGADEAEECERSGLPYIAADLHTLSGLAHIEVAAANPRQLRAANPIYSLALGQLQRALRYFGKISDWASVASLEWDVAFLKQKFSSYDSILPALEMSRIVDARFGEKFSDAYSAELYAAVATRMGLHEFSLRFLGLANGMREFHQSPRTPDEDRWLRRDTLDSRAPGQLKLLDIRDLGRDSLQELSRDFEKKVGRDNSRLC